MRTLIFASCLVIVLLSPCPATAEWSPLGSGTNDSVIGLTVYGNDVVAGGSFTQAGGHPANHIARWDGASWGPLGLGTNNTVRVLTAYNGELIAAGEFTRAGGEPALFIARWANNNWGSLGSGIDGYYPAVFALTVYNSELIAGGVFDRAGGASASNIAQWDGGSWTSLGSGVNGAVAALMVHDDELIVGGCFTEAGGISANHIAQWDGISWSPLGPGMDDCVFALAVYNGELIAGGRFTTAGGILVNSIARWDGSTWSPLGSGFGGAEHPEVYTLAVHNNELIAGGNFTTAGGDSTMFIARWDGNTWRPLGTGMDWPVFCLASYAYEGDLIAGGGFTQAGDVPVNHVANWDGLPIGACCNQDGTCTITTQGGCLPPNQWLGAGTSCGPALCTTGACCLASYCLITSETDCSGYGGTYEGNATSCEPNPCPTSTVDEGDQDPSLPNISAAPIPSQGEISIFYELPAATAVTIQIFGAAGSLVRHFSEGPRPAGQNSKRWDGRDDHGRKLPAGVFFARIVTAEGGTTGRVILAR